MGYQNETPIKFLTFHIRAADKNSQKKTKSEGRVKLALSKHICLNQETTAELDAQQLASICQDFRRH